jgi:Tol biopolymer transport system component
LLNTEFKPEFLIEATNIRIKIMRKPFVITLLFLGLSFAVHAQVEPRLFSADDVFDLEYANDPRISPDGAQIVYERRANDIMTDNTVSNLWVVNVDGSNHRPLVSGTADASSPRWSADGERIAYVQATVNGTGIFVRWMDTGQTALLANLQKSPADLSWSPDGRWLAFVMSVPAKSEPIAEPRAKPDSSFPPMAGRRAR